MRFLLPLLLAASVFGQPRFTLEQVMSAPFPSSLTSSPGGKIAWVSNQRGVHNVMVAEPPAYRPRAITPYTQDDGQEIADLCWMPDETALVYVRGGSANPSSDPKGVSEDVWVAGLDGSAPRKLGEGNSPAVSSKGRVAWVRGGRVWWTTAEGKTEESLTIRGGVSQLRWSPDGSRLAFVTARGDHSLIAEYDSGALRYLDAATDFDSNPEWSDDGRQVVFLRVPSNGKRPIREAQRSAEPWSIRVADAATGAGREVWRAKPGRGSVPRNVTARNQVLWGADGRIVFAWEGDGWTHLYSVAGNGGEASLLTPGAFEVEDVDLAPGAREITYSSNQGDSERRHLWRVAVSGGGPVAITRGQGIEVAPSGPAFLQSDARRPMHPVVRLGSEVRDLQPLPDGFPTSLLVEPEPVTFQAADGVTLHGEVFKPARAKAPAVVFFHGGSRRQMLLGWHPMYYYHNAYAMNQYLASLGYVVLSVNYRSGIGYGMEFREALHYGASGGSEYADVAAAGAYLKTRPDVDAARIGAWGGSYGGYLTAMALARGSDVYKAGVDFHGVHDWARELNIPPGEPDYKLAFDSSPMAFVDTWRSPVLLIAGDDDPDVQFNQTVMLADALRRKKVPVERLIFPDEVHDFLLHRTWLTAYEAAAKFLLGHL